MAPWEDYLNVIYYNPKYSAGFARPQKLYKEVQREGKLNSGMYRIGQFLQDKRIL